MGRPSSGNSEDGRLFWRRLVGEWLVGDRLNGTGGSTPFPRSYKWTVASSWVLCSAFATTWLIYSNSTEFLATGHPGKVMPKPAASPTIMATQVSGGQASKAAAKPRQHCQSAD